MRKTSRIIRECQETRRQKEFDAAKPQPCRNQIDLAESLLNSKKYWEAEKILCAVSLVHPELNRALNLLIRSYCETGRVKEAEKAFSYAATQGALSPVGCVSMIQLHVKTDLELANCILATAVEHTVADTSVFNAMISAYLRERMSSNALELLDRAINSGQADSGTCHMMLSSLLDNDNYSAAKTLLRKALKYGLADPALVRELMDFGIGVGKSESAMSILREAKDNESLTPALKTQLEEFERTLMVNTPKKGKNGKRRSDPPEGDLLLERVFGERRDEALNYNFKIHHYLSIGEIENAFEAFQKAARENFVDEPLYNLLLLACKDSGDFQMAKDVFDAAVRNNRADDRIRVLMATIFMQNDKMDEAQEMLIKLVNDSTHHAPYSYLFEIYYLKGRFDDILSFIPRISGQLQEHPRIELWRLEALRKKKRYEEVIQGADALLERSDLENDHVYLAKILKGYALTHNGKPREAFGLLDEVVGAMPADNVHFLRAICGMVFAYRSLESSRLSSSERSEIISQLSLHRGTRNEHLNQDIEDAIWILKSKP